MPMQLGPEDQPPYDVEALNADRISRAQDFLVQVRRLWLPVANEIDLDLEDHAFAEYELTEPTGTTIVAVQDDEDRGVVRIKFPPIHVVSNGVLRRLTGRREYSLDHFAIDVATGAFQPDKEIDTGPVPEGLEKALETLAAYNILRLAFAPDYAPRELVEGHSFNLVEREMPSGIGYRSERWAEEPEAATILSYFEQVQAYGLAPNDRVYNPLEHQTLMHFLQNIDPALSQPQIENSDWPE